MAWRISALPRIGPHWDRRLSSRLFFGTAHWERRLSSRLVFGTAHWERRLSSRLVFGTAHWDRRLSSRLGFGTAHWERRLSSRLVFGTAQCRAKDVGYGETLQTWATSIRDEHSGEDAPSGADRKIA
ncbi:MAG: hypothetical protein N838_05845 [Thiohalocapsa sp. PB-PSB1]|jgi:hypothetical protein|nr:MAG: hypothetical protein N838_05845 [Thiohalocapsa sp. PB-PSB1]